MRGGIWGYVFIAPSFLFLTVFLAIPIGQALLYSFTSYDLIEAPRFAGLDNYVRLLRDERFRRAILNTVYFAAVTVPVGTALALVLAVLVNRAIRGVQIFRTAYYLPVVTSLVGVSLIWLWLYEPELGLLNDVLEVVGLPRLKWLQSPETAMPAIILLSVWKNMGLHMTIYLAGLQGIPQHLYEAAEIDGAGAWRRFRGITLPLLAPTTYFVVVFYFINALQMFVQVWVMTPGGGGGLRTVGGPLDSTLTVVALVYVTAFQNLQMGYASAMSFALFLIILVITLLNTRLLRYEFEY